MPNTPITLQRPPPTTKGTKEHIMMETLPDISTTVTGMSTLRLLSTESSDFVSMHDFMKYYIHHTINQIIIPFFYFFTEHQVRLGQYPQEYFTERFPRVQIKRFQRDLRQLSEVIQTRNDQLSVPYTYLDPAKFENSVSIWTLKWATSSAVGLFQRQINEKGKNFYILHFSILLNANL